MVNQWSFIDHIGKLLRAPYPPRCLLCDSPGMSGRDLCAPCQECLPWNRVACPACALPLPAGMAENILCAHCLRKPPPYDAAWSLFRHVEPLRYLHRRLKFNERLSHARLLGDLLACALEEKFRIAMPLRPDRIIVMPLHPSRLRRRGFNQALELVRPAAQRLNIALDAKSCRRTRATEPQTGLPAGRRKANVRGAFACDIKLSGQSVVIFDDIVTTGHTVEELARTLRRAGAAHITVWSLARA